jgi:hypothetical protein
MTRVRPGDDAVQFCVQLTEYRTLGAEALHILMNYE